MKISAINYQTKPVFTGENSTKNKLKNAAGAAAIALAAMSPSAQAEAQYPIYPNTYYTYSTSLKVPTSFIIGDTSYPDYDKSRDEIFEELDKNSNGILSEREVVSTEIKNWNLHNPLKATSSMLIQWQRTFRRVARNYNEENSNPHTINYNEFNNIMDDYEEQKANTVVVPPIIPYPYYMVPPPPPPHHHHHHRHHHHRH